MAFFECNLEKTAPEHLYWEGKSAYEEVVEKINRRTEKLNRAYSLVCMKPETFQVLTSELFRKEELSSGNVEHFDAMTPKQLADYADLAFCGEETETRLTFPNAEVLFDTAYATVKEWESLRHIGIGGSDSAVICDVSSFKTKRGLYYDKVGYPVKININEDKQSVFDRGHAVEDNVIGAFCRITGAVRIRDTRMFRSRTHPHCIADIDAILRMPDGKLRIFEAKSTVAENQPAWDNNQVPPYYLTQCRHYPAVLDDPRIEGTFIGCLFVVDWTIGGRFVASQYDEDRFVSRYIPRDSGLELDQLNLNEKFWTDYIESGIEPPVTDPGGKAIDELKSITGPSNPDAPPVDLTSRENAAAVMRLNELKKKMGDVKAFQIDPLQKEYDELKYRLIEQLGTAPDGLVTADDGIWEVRYRASKKTEIDTALLKTCYPDIYDRVVTVNKEASRRFSIEPHRVRAKAAGRP